MPGRVDLCLHVGRAGSDFLCWVGLFRLGRVLSKKNAYTQFVDYYGSKTIAHPHVVLVELG